jgi:hypothetical protein
MTADDQNEIAKLERQRDAAIIVSLALMLAGVLLLSFVAYQAWR